ncbi:uncharacterized protein [Parasteatoda tepidariorum]|uniref:uncharacterized protein n=1 Tax=Parasteatoda tepidariorum TaxID=114398 RepID=UPI00077FCE4F|nr:uncharacterized protein LOC107444403 [Parasteatoda tepidariorum]
MIVIVTLMAFLVVHDSLALNPNYRDCSDNECYYYDNQTDPRNQVIDLYDAIESKMADSIPMPDFDLYASFHGGILKYYYDDTMDSECICPLTRKSDDIYAIFHDDVPLDIQYNWTIHWSPFTSYTINGSMDISAQVFYEVYFINDTNGGGPSIDRVNITSFDIYSWWFEGQPLKMLEKIPDELFNKTMGFVLKQIIEDKMALTYNNAIQDAKRNFHRPTFHQRRASSVKILNLLKSRRKNNTRKSKYFFKRMNNSL